MPFVARLRSKRSDVCDESDAVLIDQRDGLALYSGTHGLFEVSGVDADDLDGDVVHVDPAGRRVERLVRAGGLHNTLVVTERCDQLCVMCSQPPKKTHRDRFAALTAAALLAPPGTTLTISGGEPTLYKAELFSMVEAVLGRRVDMQFQILSNGQHFDADDVERLGHPVYERVRWGIPLYAGRADVHDEIVAKPGAFDRLHDSFVHLMRAAARIELRTVLLTRNVDHLPELANYLAARLSFVEVWSIMQLEHTGFAKGRWLDLYVDHRTDFAKIGAAVDTASLFGLPVRLFNFARCGVPEHYRAFAVASIADWKRRYPNACEPCRERHLCSGFFEWHPRGADPESVCPL